MSCNAEVEIVLAQPISPEQLQRYQDCCKGRWGMGLPEDYVAFLLEHDGLMMREISKGDSDSQERDPQSFQDHAIMSSEVVMDWVRSTRADIAHPDGLRTRTFPAFLPFYDLTDVGYHAFDFSGTQPAVADVDAERLWETEAREIIAPKFLTWFEAFIRMGLEPFQTKFQLLSSGSLGN